MMHFTLSLEVELSMLHTTNHSKADILVVIIFVVILTLWSPVKPAHFAFRFLVVNFGHP